jgi:hypothetical protein
MSTVVALFDLGSTWGWEAEGTPVPCRYPDNGRWLVIDVWESGEALNQFAQTLMPILQKAGLQANPPKTYPVHNIIPG